MTRIIPHQGEAHITGLVSSIYVLLSVVFFQTVLCNRLAGPLLIVPIANSVHGGKPGTHSCKACEKSRYERKQVAVVTFTRGTNPS